MAETAVVRSGQAGRWPARLPMLVPYAMALVMLVVAVMRHGARSEVVLTSIGMMFTGVGMLQLGLYWIVENKTKFWGTVQVLFWAGLIAFEVRLLLRVV